MFEKALELLEEKKFGQLKSFLAELNPADIALFMEEIPQEALVKVFRILPKDLAAETFTFMESDLQEHLIHSFSDSELKAVMDEIYLDDAVDIIEEMLLEKKALPADLGGSAKTKEVGDEVLRKLADGLVNVANQGLALAKSLSIS